MEYVVYFMSGDRPLFWLGSARFSPYLLDALKFYSINAAGFAAENDPEYPVVNGITIGEVNGIRQLAQFQMIKV